MVDNNFIQVLQFFSEFQFRPIVETLDLFWVCVYSFLIDKVSKKVLFFSGKVILLWLCDDLVFLEVLAYSLNMAYVAYVAC
jgi:hypothetical protein